MYKKLLSLALALGLCLSLCPFPTIAAGVTITESVPPKYSEISDFHEGLAKAWVGSGSGRGTVYIDKTGKEVICCLDMRGSDFCEGLARVETNRKYGFIDKTGKVVIPCKYDSALDFSEGLAAVKLNGQWGYIDTSGNVVIPFRNYSGAYDFHDGFAEVGIKYTNPTYWNYGLIDKTGKEITPIKYVEISNFKEGIAVVLQRFEGKDFSGLIDKSGKEILAPSNNGYKAIDNFSDGRALASRDGKWGYLDTQGNEVIPCLYSSTMTMATTGFLNGTARVYLEGKGQGVIDKFGNEVIPIGKYWFNTAHGTQFIARRVSDIHCFVMDCSGNIVFDVPEQYTTTSLFTNGFMPVQRNGMYGFIDQTGNEVVPCKYSRVMDFSEGLAAVQLNGKWGFVDQAGNEVVPCKYDDVANFTSGLAAVMPDEKARVYGFIDKTGREVTPIKYKFENTLPKDAFVNGLMPVKVQDPNSSWNTLYGFINQNGSEVIPCIYSHQYRQYEDCVVVRKQVDNNYLWGLYVINSAPKPAPAPEPTVGGFSDVKESDYFAQPVLWAVEKGVTSGTSATTFSPNQTCTTAQILTMIWAANGSPKPSGPNPFPDVKESDYFYQAALWAYEQGLVSGAQLNGGNACTRGSTVEYLWKLAGSPDAGESRFADAGAYSQAVAWASGRGITGGTSDTTFSPNQTCTRGQIMTFLYKNFAQ